MLDLRPVFLVNGVLLLILGGAMLLPALADLAIGHADWGVFLLSSFVTLFVGGGLALANYEGRRTDLSIRQAFILTSLSWTMMAAFGAVPFYFSGLKLSFIDSAFEAMSGLTTTGATVIVGLDAAPPGILLWRSLLHWLGGIGIIVMGVAVLPMLKVGGMQLFKTESSDNSEKILPRAAQIAGAIGWTYLLLTVLCAVALWLAGMSPFDAINHAMSTMSTGGFSTSDDSISNWQSPTIEWILVVFMVISGMTFTLLVRAVRGQAGPLWRDSQTRVYLGVVAFFSLTLGIWHAWAHDVPFIHALRETSFSVVAVITTTGFMSVEYGLWGGFALVVFFFLSFVGASTGSTSGGIKIFRFEILFLRVRGQARHLLTPHGVFALKYNGRTVPEEVPYAISAFLYLYLGTWAALAIGLGLAGCDLVTALSGAASALANVGPGLGDIIGPAGNYSTLPQAAKFLLTAGMLLGRLEFFTIFVLLSRRFWRS